MCFTGTYVVWPVHVGINAVPGLRGSSELSFFLLTSYIFLDLNASRSTHVTNLRRYMNYVIYEMAYAIRNTHCI